MKVLFLNYLFNQTFWIIIIGCWISNLVFTTNNISVNETVGISMYIMGQYQNLNKVQCLCMCSTGLDVNLWEESSWENKYQYNLQQHSFFTLFEVAYLHNNNCSF